MNKEEKETYLESVIKTFKDMYGELLLAQV